MIHKIIYSIILIVSILSISEQSVVRYTVNDDVIVNVITNGSYSIIINNNTWLASADTFLQANGKFYSLLDKTLILNGTRARSGVDILGRWQSTDYYYMLPNDDVTQFVCSIIVYLDLAVVRFTQNFTNDLYQTTTDFNSVSSSFPSFYVSTIQKEKVGYLSFGGMMAGDMEKIFGKWNSLTGRINDGMQGGPLVLFNQNGDTVILSSMSNFMSASLQHKQFSGGSIHFGVMGGADHIPKNYTVDFILYFSREGINKGMQGWGQTLLKFYQKDDSLSKSDFTNNYLGYWTDNGAYYYWMTEPGQNYQQTIIDVFTNFTTINIPFRYLQYDSWWYGGPLGQKGGCSKWDSPPNIFPDGITYMFKRTGLPASAHNKYWDEKVVYAKQNGGSYNFLIDSYTLKALPNDQKFWDDLMYNASKWGLLTYEQDWLNHQTLDFTPLLTDVNLGRNWLLQMGNAAINNNVTIQYCMSLSRHILQSVEMPAVTQARVTNDYATNWQYGGEQWRLGVSSIFASSLGLSPFKDVFWSTENQPGNRYGPKATEPYPELESVVSTLSYGPVGPGDKIGSIDKSVIMRCCNDDGLILKPSKPITALDAQIYAEAFNNLIGEVWSTYSDINGYIFGIVLGIDIQNTFYVTDNNCGFSVTNNTVFWKDGNPQNVYPFTNPQIAVALELNKACTKKDFCLYNVAPVFNISGLNVAFLGESAKWVPVSSKRVNQIQATSNSLTIYVQGALKEQVQFAFSINNTYKQVLCDFSTINQLKITVLQNTITCL